MKNLVFLSLLFSFSVHYGQDLKPVAQKVKDYFSQNKSVHQYDLFTAPASPDKTNRYAQAAEGVSVFQLKTAELSRLLSDKPEGMELSFPFEGKTITVELVKNKIFTDDFVVNTSSGKVIPKNSGIYYQGIVKGNLTSVVSFSFFEDDLVGMVSVKEIGNIVVSRTKDSRDFVSYNDQKLAEKKAFACEVVEVPESQNRILNLSPEAASAALTDNCVRIYLETTFGVYELKGESAVSVRNWVTGIFNNVKTLYFNDGINIALSEIFVWDTTETAVYPGTKSRELLDQFRVYRKDFNGDVGQLWKYPLEDGGVAYQDILCNKDYNYSFVGVDAYNIDLPNFSWNVFVSTHELGHNLASPHTHNCSWNGNKTAIDGCAVAYSATLSEGCNGPVPEDGGTIMSYCHLLYKNSLANGFGPQPSALIRNRVNTRPCLGKNCTTSCEVNASMGISSITSNSITANIYDSVVSNSSWKYALMKPDGTIVQKGNTESKQLNFTGLTPNTYYELKVGNLCSGPDAYNQNILLLTDDAWCGKTFTDTGGISKSHGHGESFTKTFFPAQKGQNLKLLFKQLDLEINADSLFVYNGNSTGAPIFPGGKLSGNLLPPSAFESTHPSGAITVHFKSDRMIARAGWAADFSCTSLAVDETTAQDGIKVYPNPTQNLLSVESSELVEEFSIYDISGREVAPSKKVNSKKFTIDFSAFTPGVYMVNFQISGNKKVKKVIKE